MFSVKDLNKGLFQMAGLNWDERKSTPQQSLAQGKKSKKHRKPAIALYLQQGEMEGFMDDYMEKDEKEQTPEAAQAS